MNQTVLPPTTSPGRVVIVDSDFVTLEALAEALRRHGHTVSLATDGRSGLARAVELRPDVVLVSHDVSEVDVRTFVEILAENPHTAGTKVFILGIDQGSGKLVLGSHVEGIFRPFHPDEVASRVDDVIVARRNPPRPPELEGDLEQVAIADLLQVFAVNAKTGRLETTSERGTATLWVRSGHPMHIIAEGHEGPKALYRLLRWTSGHFEFYPGGDPPAVTLGSPADHYLLEGARRTDELRRMSDELPPEEAPLRLRLRPTNLPGIGSNRLAAVVELLERQPTRAGLLDASRVPDLELTEVLYALRKNGALDHDQPSPRIPIAVGEEVASLRPGILKLRRPGTEGPVRIGVVGQASHLASLLRSLGGVDGFTAAPTAPLATGRGALGVLGGFELLGLELELFALPPDPSLRPWWGMALASAQTLLLLEDVHDDLDELGLDVVRAPEAAHSARDAVAVLRTVLSVR